MTALKWHQINLGCDHRYLTVDERIDGWECDACSKLVDLFGVCGADDVPHQWRETPHMGDTCTRCGQRYECTGNAYHEISG